jgi:hypothetical protein
MTNQEMFDRVLAHARTQRMRSYTIIDKGDRMETLCLYRGPGGAKCFMGALIPDALYERDMEGKSIKMPYIRDAAGLTEEQIPFARKLQKIHDTMPVADWEDCFVTLAKEFNLVYTPPTA